MKNTNNKTFNLAQNLTNQIIEQLEKGTVPWQKEWSTGVAYNYISNKAYSTLNQMFLIPGAYLTFNQVKNLGGSLKKGAKSSLVVFFSFFDKKELGKDSKTGEEKETIKKRAMLKYYRVFHQSNIEGIEFKEPDVVLFQNSEIEDAQTIVDSYFSNSNCSLDVCLSQRAYYNSSTDEVVMPCLDQFTSSESFYSILFHEMTHSTGHVSRLSRNLGNKFGSKLYAKEELVAEIGAAMLNSVSGISNEKLFNNSVAYIDGWIKALQNDYNLIVHASSRAEKAVNYILSHMTSDKNIAA